MTWAVAGRKAGLAKPFDSEDFLKECGRSMTRSAKVEMLSPLIRADHEEIWL
jgi:hypothetical protein